MISEGRPGAQFGRERSGDVRRIHDQLDELAADRDQMGLLLQLAIEISSDLELEPTLHRIISAALTLTGARYGAIGVWGPDGLLTSFVHDGMDERTVDQIGHLPVGKGLLGALRDRTDLLRLDDLTQHSASAGFPDGHPPMRAFLGIPIRIRDDKAFGSLYVADDRTGRTFSESDEVTGRALASVAAVAIDNAQLFDATRIAALWTSASREITAAVLSDGQPILRPLQLIAARACELTEAEQAIVLFPDDADQPDDEVDTLVVSAAVGRYADDVLGQRVAVDGSTSGSVFRSGEPVITETFRKPIQSFTDIGERPAIVVPLWADGHSLGVLVVARNVNAARFGAKDLDLVRDFAGHAAIALTIARARRYTAELALLTDRERIAHDLHDQVIQRVFAVGLDLQGAIARIRDPEMAQRLSRSVDELQAVITEIRSTIFNLQHSVDSTGGLAARIHNVFEQLTNNRDIAARLNLSGPLSIVSAELAANAEAVVTEALSNAVRHSGASEVTVSVAVGDDLTIMVTDNGCGIPADNRRSSGLHNLARRAESAGGVFTVSDAETGGTKLVWTAPLTSE